MDVNSWVLSPQGCLRVPAAKPVMCSIQADTPQRREEPRSGKVGPRDRDSYCLAQLTRSNSSNSIPGASMRLCSRGYWVSLQMDSGAHLRLHLPALSALGAAREQSAKQIGWYLYLARKPSMCSLSKTLMPYLALPESPCFSPLQPAGSAPAT